MKTNIKFFNTFVITILSSTLVGCFSDNHTTKLPSKGNDGSSVGILSSIKVSTFDVYKSKFSRSQSDVDYIGRNDLEIRTGSRKNTILDIYGKRTASIPDDKITFLGKGFTYEQVNLAKISVVKSNTDYHYYWLDHNGSRANKIQKKYKIINLSKQTNQLKTAQNGFLTVLNDLARTKDTAFTFPDGAYCYVLDNSTKHNYVEIHEHDITKFSSLNEWKKSQNQNTRLNKVKLGQANNIDVWYYDSPNNYHQAAVLYNNKVYTATYVKAHGYEKSSDIKKGLIYCEAYNKIAANFIEENIKLHYK